MQCPICRTEKDQWKNVDQYRIKPQGMSICQSCGFVSYPSRYKNKKEIIDFYKNEYRNCPSANNVYTSERKMQYHAHFLSDLFEQWRNEERQDVLITDIGSAFGMFLNWARGQVPNSKVLGVELTPSFVRNAWHMFQIQTLDDFDDSKKYDLISSYKSLEHILDPDIELRRYLSSLKEDGYLYISVPLWFECLHNFGVSSKFDIEYYYDVAHINVWTRKHFLGLIETMGGVITKENHSYYGSCFLVQKKKPELSNRDKCKEDPAKIEEYLDKVFKVSELQSEGKFKEIIDLWPNCPHAWQCYYETNRKKFHEKGFDWIYENVCTKGIEACNNESDMHFMAADICARYDKYQKAIEHLSIFNELRPNMPNFFSHLGNCYRTLAKRATNEEDRIRFIDNARRCAKMLGDIGTQHKGESLTWLMHDNAQIPTPFEGK